MPLRVAIGRWQGVLESVAGFETVRMRAGVRRMLELVVLRTERRAVEAIRSVNVGTLV